MKKQKVDWVRALHDLEEAKKLQKKKSGVPAWVWGPRHSLSHSARGGYARLVGTAGITDPLSGDLDQG